MTRAERELIREAVDEKRRKAAGRVKIDPFVYARVLAACCPESTINIEAHARRVALKVAQARGW